MISHHIHHLDYKQIAQIFILEPHLWFDFLQSMKLFLINHVLFTSISSASVSSPYNNERFMVGINWTIQWLNCCYLNSILLTHKEACDGGQTIELLLRS